MTPFKKINSCFIEVAHGYHFNWLIHKRGYCALKSQYKDTTCVRLSHLHSEQRRTQKMTVDAGEEFCFTA